jgi:signal transduction histidine kinase/CheY-like chemotaxis protein
MPHFYDVDSTTLDTGLDRGTITRQVSSAGTGELPQLGRDRGQLIVLVGNRAGTAFDLGDETLIGRANDVHVNVGAEDASRRHARIRRTPEGVFILEDLGSRNGTLVNGVPVKEQALKLGDKIRIGAKTVLMFTQHDELEDLLLQSQKLESIGQLAGGIAHDFNNLLGAILANVSFLQGLANVDIGERDVVESLADIDVAAHRAADLTAQLLGFARRTSYEKRPVGVNQLVDEVRSLLSRTISKNIHLSVELEPDLTVVGDSSQLHQVLMNLCINARDAMPKGGALTVSAKLCHLSDAEVLTLPFLIPGTYVVVAIKDTGTGMDADTLRRAFEPFFTTKSAGQGTGMGLATAYGIIKNHGGHIQAESQPGRGSMFSVYLPAADAPSTTAEVKAMEQGTTSVHTRRIHTGLVIVVDDEEIFRNSARRLLEGLGYGVLCAADGPQAIELLRSHHELVELVLLDMVMPMMNGVEVFHELRKIKPTVKVLLNSGHAELQSVRTLLASGAEAFLQKPYGAGALAEALSKAMARK